MHVSLTDFHVGHPLGVELSAVGPDPDVARSEGFDMRIYGHAAEGEIAGSHDLDAQRVRRSIRYSDRTRACDGDLGRPIDARSRNIRCARDIEIEPAINRPELRVAGAGQIGVKISDRPRYDLPGPADVELERSCH